MIRFDASLLRPRSAGKPVTWTFLRLPKDASGRLPSRAMVSVEGALNGVKFRGTLEPDGEGGHWLKVPRTLSDGAGAAPGDVVSLELSPAAREPEPKVPADFKKALGGDAKASATWLDITALARRDWVHWIVSPKQAETRARRIVTACDMLSKGKRRPCCFDRSGMYSKGLECPEPEIE